MRCVEGRFPADGYYAPRLRICVFVASKLLSRVQAWDAGDRLIEDYEYRDLRVNVASLTATSRRTTRRIIFSRAWVRDFAEADPAYDDC